MIQVISPARCMHTPVTSVDAAPQAQVSTQYSHRRILLLHPKNTISERVYYVAGRSLKWTDCNMIGYHLVLRTFSFFVNTVNIIQLRDLCHDFLFME